MLRLMASVAMCGVLQLGMGCKHVGGECDCAHVPGDSVGINPHLPVYGSQGHVHAAPAPLPVITTAPVISSAPAITSSPAALPPSTSGFESIAPPKTTPPGR